MAAQADWYKYVSCQELDMFAEWQVDQTEKGTVSGTR